MLITSLENDRVKHYCKLKDKKYRDKTGLFLVEGMHLVLEAYKAGAIEELILEKDEVLPLDVPIVYVTNDIIHKMTQVDTPSKVMAVCKKQENTLPNASRILILDGIQDPGNIGTLIRTAVASGVYSIAASPECAHFWSPKALRAGMGAHFAATLYENVKSEAVRECFNARILAADARGGRDLYLTQGWESGHTVWMMGSEGQGISQAALAVTDERLYIPIEHDCESLNVSAAAAVCLFEQRRRRLAQKR